MIALNRITSHIKTYEPGEKLGSEFSERDIKRLIRLKAVDGAADIVTDDETDEELFGSGEPDSFLTKEGLDKIKTKELLIEYARKIGLDGLDIKTSREVLTNSILNYIEEIEAGEGKE